MKEYLKEIPYWAYLILGLFYALVFSFLVFGQSIFSSFLQLTIGNTFLAVEDPILIIFSLIIVFTFLFSLIGVIVKGISRNVFWFYLILGFLGMALLNTVLNSFLILEGQFHKGGGGTVYPPLAVMINPIQSISPEAYKFRNYIYGFWLCEFLIFTIMIYMAFLFGKLKRTKQ